VVTTASGSVTQFRVGAGGGGRGVLGVECSGQTTTLTPFNRSRMRWRGAGAFAIACLCERMVRCGPGG